MDRIRPMAQDSPPDLVVVEPVRDWTCTECKGTGDLLIMDDAGPLCLALRPAVDRRLASWS
jgi:hypothetical protein